MFLKEIDPFLRYANYVSINTKTPDNVFYKLRTRDCRLFLIFSGHANIVIEKKKYSVSPGSIILFQAGTPYTWYPHPDNSFLSFISINFDFTHENCHIATPFYPIHATVFSQQDIIETVEFSDAIILNSPIVLDKSSVRESMFRHLVTEHSIRGEYSDELLTSLLKSIIINVVKDISSIADSSNSSFLLTRRITQYISKNYRDTITYESLEKEFNMNAIYMNRIFKKHCGVSIHSFIVNYRINVSMELLQSTSLSINEISRAVGFSDFPHFLKTFKRIVGQTPTNYRNHSNTHHTNN